MATFRLPSPVSANRYWRKTRQGRVYVSEEAQAYKAQAGWIARTEGVEPIDGDVSFTIDVYVTRKNIDLDNCLKVTLDSLNGIAFHDDQQVVEIHARRFEVPKAKRGQKREGYVIVTVDHANYKLSSAFDEDEKSA